MQNNQELVSIICWKSAINGLLWHLATIEDELIPEAIFSRRMEEHDLREKRTTVGDIYKDVVINQTTLLQF